MNPEFRSIAVGTSLIFASLLLAAATVSYTVTSAFLEKFEERLYREA